VNLPRARRLPAAVLLMVCAALAVTTGTVLFTMDRAMRSGARQGSVPALRTHPGGTLPTTGTSASPLGTASRTTPGPTTAGQPYATDGRLGDPTQDPGPDPVFASDPDLRRTDVYTYRFTRPGDHQLAPGTLAFQYDVTTGTLKARLAERKPQLTAATGLALYLTGGTALSDADLAALQSVHRDLGVPNLVRLYVYNLKTIQGGVECTPASGLACAGQTARGGLFPYLWHNGWWGSGFKYLVLDDLEAVPDGAFSNHGFSGVSLRGARSIGVMAFGHGPYAKWSVLYLPSVERIAHDAFRRNQGLVKVVLPRVVTIDDYAFDDATSLQYMNAPQLVRFGRNALNDSGRLRSVNFPKVEYMGINSINGLLVGLRLPALRTVDKSAFRGFPNLRWVYLPSLSVAADDALAANPRLERVVLGDRPPRQGSNVFAGSGAAVIYHAGGAGAWAQFLPAGNPSLPVRALG